MPPLETFIPAAAILLHKAADESQLYLARRSPSLKFLGGFHAFPGGKVDPEDYELAQGDDLSAIGRVAAIRELFEEAGIMLARDLEGRLLSESSALTQARQDIRSRKITFLQLLKRCGWSLCQESLVPFGKFTTPPFSPQRFETRFYHAQCPPGQQPLLFPGELEDGTWGTPREHLRRWRNEEILLSPPVLAILERLEQMRVFPTEVTSLHPEEFALERVRFNPWVEVVSVVCPGPTLEQIGNVFLAGEERFYVLDPGPSRQEGKDDVARAIQRKQALGQQFEGILLTHHHPDHVREAAWFAREFSVPVLAHCATALKLSGKVHVDRFIQEDDILGLGNHPGTNQPLNLMAIHTPGHASGHLVFWEPKNRTVFLGDLFSTSTTILISPPDGHLGTYIQSLKKTRALNPVLALPFHGCPSLGGERMLEQAVEHRQKRERGLWNALEKGLESVEDLAGEIYRGLPEPLIKLAQRQVLAGLIKLWEEGKINKLEGEVRWEIKK